MNSEPSIDLPERRPLEPLLREYLAIILRGKWIILLSLAAAVGAAFLYVNFKSPVFRAVATIVINTRAPRASPFIEMLALGTERNLSQNVLETLQSHSLQENVAEKLVQRGFADSGLTRRLPILRQDPGQPQGRGTSLVELAIQRFKGAMSFSAIPGTDMIRIQSESRDPGEAALIANLFAESSYELNLYHSRAKSRAFREFLEAQLKDKQRALEENEAALQRFMQSSGVVSVDDETRRVIDQLGDLEAQRDAADISLRELDNTLASYREQLEQREVSVSKSIGEANDPYIRLLQEQLAALEVRRDMTVAQLPASDVEKGVYDEKTRDINDQIATLRKNLAQRTEEYIRTLLPAGSSAGEKNDPINMLRQLKQKVAESAIEMQSLRAKRSALDSVISLYGRKFSVIPRRSMDFARLQRARVSSEKLYLSIQEKYNDAVITEQSEFGYIEVIEPAAVPVQPSSPKKLLTIALGVLIGLGLGTVTVVTRERLNLRIQSPDDLKTRGFTVLSTILRMDGALSGMNGRNARSRNGNGRGTPSPVLTVPFSPAAESYRHLRTSVLYSRRNPDVRTILVTSSKPGEGKSTTAVNLAIVCAQAGKKVLLLDGDFRKPQLHASFGVDQSPGLADHLLEGAEVVIRTTEVANLSLLTAGRMPKNPAELLGSGTLAGFLAGMKEKYDLVIIDSSPVLIATDTTVLSSLVDVVVMVAAAGDTRIPELEQACGLIAEVHGKPPDIILNKFDVGTAYGMAYGHYTYGSYHYTDEHQEKRRLHKERKQG